MLKEKSKMKCEYATVDGKNVKEAGVGVRHVQSMLLFWCLAVAYGLRVSMSVAIVAMTSNFTDTPGIEVYEWDERTTSLILSSFFWGYMLMQLPAGQLAHNFGAKTLLLVAMIVNGVVQILLPWGASVAGWKAVCACRIIQGLTQACVMPCSHNLLGKWAPLLERGRLSSYVYAGQSAGTVIILPVTGYLAASRWGWPSIFYSSGICSLIFGLVWGYFGSESPAAHKNISEQEKLYIESSLGIREDLKKVKLSIPWKSILSSPGMWAIAAAHIGNTWVQLTLYTELPSYMDKVMNVKIKNNGMLTALPFLTNWIMQYVFSHLTDYFISNNIMTMTATRKLANSIGSWVTTAGLVAVAFAPTDNFILIESLLVFSISAKAATYVGFYVNHIDLSPNFAGTMMSISNTMSNSIGTLAPVAAGYILTDNTDKFLWRKVFLLSAGFYSVSNLIYVIFGTAKKQPWNEPLPTNVPLTTYNVVQDEVEVDEYESEKIEKNNLKV